MHALIVVAHPDPRSLTHAVAASLANGVSQSGHAAEIADLMAEGFDPRFTATDHAVHLKRAAPSAEILAEQARIDRADTLVLVYPVYWWSMPGLLKGWIDRVFINGWAYDEVPGGKLEKKLGHLPVHLVALGGADQRTYERHGYSGAMRTQIDHGIFDYCGTRIVTSEFLLPSDTQTMSAHLDTAQAIGGRLFQTAERGEAANAA